MATAEMKSRADERRTLRNYLARYFRALEQRSLLQSRLQRMERDIDPEPGSETMPEIEARICRQADEVEQSALNVMDIIGHLPAHSIERTIMELRHIDCRTWQDVCDTIYMTRSPCSRHYNKGLDRLLAMDDVRRIIGLDQN